MANSIIPITALQAGNLPIHIAASTRNALLAKELLQSHVDDQLKAVNKVRLLAALKYTERKYKIFFHINGGSKIENSPRKVLENNFQRSFPRNEMLGCLSPNF